PAGDPAAADALAWAHPVVREWFLARFGSATEPQVEGWPHILAGDSTLISAPTGSGKTLAAFLACIDRLVRKAVAGELQDRTEVLYISPLKALGNDIQKNLEAPLAEILALAEQRGYFAQQPLPGISAGPAANARNGHNGHNGKRADAVIRTAVRTGDTLMHERRSMLKRPPHILVTTPESLYILLTAEKSREILRNVETVIVDEIHSVAGSKRGSHLTLSLERLDDLLQKSGRGKPLRIGLSATQKPLDEIAAFLAGQAGRTPVIVNVGHKRALDLAIEVPPSELGPVATNGQWDETYDRLAQLIQEHRSTIIFVNTRRHAERIAHNLSERLGEDAVAAHHGSLARRLRLEAERKLKAGEVRALVATASLELGIDVGFVDLACVMGSPRSIAIALQRVGRAGHWRGAIPKGRIFAMTRDELAECAALVRSIRQGELDRVLIPDAPLDVLAQQMVALCANEEWNEDDLFALVARAYPYRNLQRIEFDELLVMLSDGIASSRGRYGTYLHRDQVNGKVRARRGARLVAITNGGAIPENALFTVVAEPEGTIVGTLDEDFAVESLAGDVILLGNASWRIRQVESKGGRIRVEDAHGAPPSVPFWLGEAPARTAELSSAVSTLRQEISDRLPLHAARASAEYAEVVNWLKQECALDDPGAEQLIDHVAAGRSVLGAVPTQQTIIAERFFDEGGGMQLVIHSPFGARINKAWGLALRKRFCRSFNFELQAAATDNGVNIALAEQHSFPLADVFNFLHAESVQPVLEQAVLTGAPVFGTRWRWDAGRALALVRYRGGKKVPPQIQRIQADDLLASVFPQVAACQENVEGDIEIPNHPLVREVMKDVLSEAMDLEGLKHVLSGIGSGTIRTLAVDTPVPSQFSHEILNANPYAYLDDAPLEERRARAVEMRRVLPSEMAGEVGALDQDAIAEVRADAWPDVRDADELHDALQSLVAVPGNFVPPAGEPLSLLWSHGMQHLMAERRAGSAVLDAPAAATATAAIPLARANAALWFAAERAHLFHALYPEARIEAAPGRLTLPPVARDEALLALIRGWMQVLGPATAAGLAQLLALPESETAQALLRLEAAGSILRGEFVRHESNAAGNPQLTWGSGPQFCDRRLLARIHRLTIGRLRKQIEPATTAQYLRWLLRWQHVEPGAQLSGERGLLEVIGQLQGFEIPANAWERDILARRLRDYDPRQLDQLCLTGAVGWGRLSPHPATLATGNSAEQSAATRRVVPTKVAPITFFVRETAEWLPHRRHGSTDERSLSPVAREVMQWLLSRGASFFADIVRGTGRLKSEVETGLWELVAAGLVTADGFDNLRSLIDPKRRSGHGSGKLSRPRHSAGRWAMLNYEDAAGAPLSTSAEAAAHDSARDPHTSAAARDRAVESTCRMLLARYGVVFRELLARETILPRWRELLIGFRRLEDRGEIRGGRFVSGFMGEQFALPVAVESLRAMRNLPPGGVVVTVSSADPLNLVGVITPGERVPALSGRAVAYRDGVPIEPEERLAVLPQAEAQAPAVGAD
ncbi:MAG TPA: DEAD/DEAH box helicase, partial [Terriglobales bacterium]|nr:DEAD/DEAH box helicase [Terriglobales bacterium]